MILEKAIESAKGKRDAYKLDVYVLKDDDGEYYSILNFSVELMLRAQKDQIKYYTAWNLKM